MADVDITARLQEHQLGDERALDAVFPEVYDELRRIARRQLRKRRPGQTLNTTALVNDAYLKLIDQTRAEYRDRGHFFAVAATAMRHIIIDYARARRAAKRGSGAPHVDIDEAPVGVEQQLDLLLAIDRGLERLSSLNERLTRVVECRYFAGLTEVETAEALGISRPTVQRDWLKARAFLKQELASV